MKIKNANAGALTNFELLNFFQSRGASKEVAVTIEPSEYKVFEYLIGTVASHQTTENISVLMDRLKKYDLTKAEALNIINLRPTLPVWVYAMVESCDERLGEEGAEELVGVVVEVLPLPDSLGNAGQDDVSIVADQ
ncbi:hypothetical protein MLD38_027305 [Melastoma candidum]|uniref:Uncharacterized protein n=1 Tax=Melastoma candidum TaxID=119954 RepID=A0ACB9P1A8_9MYRT|nr:hypothetical protein MLD38_027305 [Melastoma candidum]